MKIEYLRLKNFKAFRGKQDLEKQLVRRLAGEGEET